MYWRKPGERFVRPLRWWWPCLTAKSYRSKSPGFVREYVARPQDYWQVGGRGDVPHREGQRLPGALRKAKVLAGPEREHKIRKALDAARALFRRALAGDEGLLKTVVNLTEFPSAISVASIPRSWPCPASPSDGHARPPEYFAIEDANGKLLPTSSPCSTLMRPGRLDPTRQRTRVARAFQRCRFFWQTDKEYVADRVEMLKSVTFQKDLGSYYEKTMRVQRLASWISETIKPEWPGNSSRRCAQSSSSRQSRSDNGIGQGIYGVARHRRRPLPACATARPGFAREHAVRHC